MSITASHYAYKRHSGVGGNTFSLRSNAMYLQDTAMATDLPSIRENMTMADTNNLRQRCNKLT